jgi:hypothetical protein
VTVAIRCNGEVRRRGEEDDDGCGLPAPVGLSVSKMLKPEKWQAGFNSDGKVFGFHKALKSIVLGGVDPSIRPEVWEFLLGCYTLSSTADYRKQLRTARRERYHDLVKQCQMMHSSIGTGSLAYVIGSKVMDMRTVSKDDNTSSTREADVTTSTTRASDATDNSNHNNNSKKDSKKCIDSSYSCARKSSSNSGELVSMRGSTDGAAYDSSCFIPSPKPYRDDGRYEAESYFDFPALPVTNLFERISKVDEDKKQGMHRLNEDDNDDGRHLPLHPPTHRKLRFEDDHVFNFQINNNVDLVMESNVSVSSSSSPCSSASSKDISHPSNSCEIGMVRVSVSRSAADLDYKSEIVNRLKISDAPETPNNNATTSQGENNGEKVSEWLWTLHRIVVDVVRTDSHLEFYEDKKNLARMSDILAVCAWVDPGTGYCQGMSDLLSPFVVLFEDNADAFWCFVMLLRRMKENFQMEGPTGVMKQLEALWHILEYTDRDMFSHLSRIGAQNLHFAFRMLLVLFRRELSFNEALCMWEMMWAADFDESMAFNTQNCPELLVLQIPRESLEETGDEKIDNNNPSSTGSSHSKQSNTDRSIADNRGIKTTYPFCGLTKSFWSKNEHFQICTLVSSTKNGDDELPVFCVAAILVSNRQKIIREARSIDDLIKIFNDNLLKIRVRRCVRTAIKLRKKYFYKLIRNRSPEVRKGD